LPVVALHFYKQQLQLSRSSSLRATKELVPRLLKSQSKLLSSRLQLTLVWKAELLLRKFVTSMQVSVSMQHLENM
jgi:hypothetical protein